jgi:hypothetical protein
MDTTKIDICNEREGVYRIVSLYSRDSIAITSQGLLELATWTEANKATLEKEAAKEKRTDHRFRSQDTAEHTHIKSERHDSHINGPDGTTD